MGRIDDQELAAYLAGATAGGRTELTVSQTAPFAPKAGAFLPIVDGEADSVSALVPTELAPILRVVEHDRLRATDPEFYAALPAGLRSLQIQQKTERCTVGYGPLVAALQTMAAHLKDAQFFIRDDEYDWLDGFALTGGRLTMQRWDGLDLELDEPEQLAELAAAHPDEKELERLAHQTAFGRLEGALQDVSFHTGQRRDKANARVQTLLRLLPGRQTIGARALLQLVTGNREEARKLARTSDEPQAAFVQATVAFAEGDCDEAESAARRAVEKAPFLAEAQLLVAVLAESAPAAAARRCLVQLAHDHTVAYPRHFGGPWGRLRARLLVRNEPMSSPLDGALVKAAEETEQRRGAALLLFGWAECLRLDEEGTPTQKAERHRRARQLLDKAQPLDDLWGEMDKCRARLRTEP